MGLRRAGAQPLQREAEPGERGVNDLMLSDLSESNYSTYCYIPDPTLRADQQVPVQESRHQAEPGRRDSARLLGQA